MLLLLGPRGLLALFALLVILLRPELAIVALQLFVDAALAAANALARVG